MQKCTAAPIVGVATRVPVLSFTIKRVWTVAAGHWIFRPGLSAAGAPIAADSVSFFQPGIDLPFPRRRP